MKAKVGAILSLLGKRVVAFDGMPEQSVEKIAAFDDPLADRNSLCFVGGVGEAAVCRVRDSCCGLVLCRPEVRGLLGGSLPGVSLIAVENPRLAFAITVATFFRELLDSQSACGTPSSTGGSIAASAWVSPHAMVEGDAEIGDACWVGHGCVLLGNVVLGRSVQLLPGAVLGGAGFGFERDPLDGRLWRLPQVGGVRIGDDVEVGVNVSINRGTFSDTVIGMGTKIDDNVYVAHNVWVGDHCLIMAGVVVCGSVTIGDGVEISPGAVIRDHVEIGEGARIGLGAVVVKNVPPGELVAGVPARPFATRKCSD